MNYETTYKILTTILAFLRFSISVWAHFWQNHWLKNYLIIVWVQMCTTVKTIIDYLKHFNRPGLYSKSVYMCWTWYIYFIWNTFLFECVGVDPHDPSASAVRSSVSRTVSCPVLSMSIRLIFLMRVLYSGLNGISLKDMGLHPKTLWESFVNFLRMIYHLWILSPLLLTIPNLPQLPRPQGILRRILVF